MPNAATAAAAARFTDNPGVDLSSANLNSLDRGGNVFQSAAGGLLIDVTACIIQRPGDAGQIAYAGATSQAVVGSQTNYVYLDGSGALQINTTGFPADERKTQSGTNPSGYVPLATVVTSASNITAINDKRPAYQLPYEVVIPDPGSGAAIAIAGYMIANCLLTIGAGAETNTVPAAQVMGQQLFIGVTSAGGGTRTITFPSVIDATGNHTKIAFTATTMSAMFIADATLNWVLVGNWRSANGAVAVLS